VYLLCQDFESQPQTFNPSLECASRFRRNTFCQPQYRCVFKTDELVRHSHSRRHVALESDFMFWIDFVSKAHHDIVTKFLLARNLDEGHICCHMTFQHLSECGRTNHSSKLDFQHCTMVRCKIRRNLFVVPSPEDKSHNPISPPRYLTRNVPFYTSRYKCSAQLFTYRRGLKFVP
jgi:hypothetical protein